MQRVTAILAMLFFWTVFSAAQAHVPCHHCPMMSNESADAKSCHKDPALKAAERCCCHFSQGSGSLPIIAVQISDIRMASTVLPELLMEDSDLHGLPLSPRILSSASPLDPLHVSVSRYLSIKQSFLI